MKTVELISVNKTYRMGEVSVCALSNANLEIAEGEFMALTGPSGSGKTSLLNLIGCLDEPTSGEIKINGTSTSQLGERELDRLRSRTFGMVFQTYNLVPVLSARENIALPLYLHGLTKAQMSERVARVLASVGIDAFADFPPDRMSGGQRQRVAIARALVTEPSVILADEPTASLDSANALSIVELMRRLNHEDGVTFVFSTHDERLLRLVDDVIEIRDGELVRQTRRAPPDRRPAAATRGKEFA